MTLNHTSLFSESGTSLIAESGTYLFSGNTFSNFRRGNPKAIKKVFRHTVNIAQNFELIGGKLIAGDSSKFRAQNSKKNNFNEKKIKRHLQYIEHKLQSYNEELASADGDVSNLHNS